MYISLVWTLAQQVNYSSDTVYCTFFIHTSQKIKCNEAVHQLLTDFKTAYDSVRWQVFYNTLASLVHS